MRPWSGALVAVLALALPLASGQTEPTLAAQGEGRVVVTLAPLGDVDGDGRDDLLRVDVLLPDPDAEDDGEARFTARALSGADVGRTLWTHEAPAGRFLAAWQDVDADGVTDLVQGDSDFGGRSESIDAVVVNQWSFRTESRQRIDVLSGATAGPLTSFVADAGTIFMDASTPVAFAADTWFNSTSFAADGAGAILDAFTSRHTTSAVAVLASVSVTEADSRLRVHRPGQPPVEVLLDADDRITSAPVFARIDAEPGLDFVLLDSRAVQPVSVVTSASRVYEIGVAAYTSAGRLAWTSPFPAGPASPLSLGLAGDLDGDGRDEVALLVSVPDPVEGVSYEVRLLSGETGKVLATLADQPTFAMVRPFGDLDGDGKEEMLVQRFDGDVSVAQVMGLDLVPLWSLPLDEAFVLNPDGPGRRLTDWSGDGLPDLAHAREVDGGSTFSVRCDDDGCTSTFTFDPFQMKLDVLGPDGKPRWSQAFEGLLAYADVPDLDGGGGADFVCIRIEGKPTKSGDLRGTNLTLEVLAGEDGSTILRHPLRGPEDPVLRDGLPLVSLVAVGDLDGRGGAELAVGLRERSADDEAQDAEPVLQDWLVFSASAGRAIARLESTPPAGDDGAPSAEAPQPGVLAEAPDLVGVGAEEGQDVPAAGFAALAAAVVAVASLRRRRA